MYGRVKISQPITSLSCLVCLNRVQSSSGWTRVVVEKVGQLTVYLEENICNTHSHSLLQPFGRDAESSERLSSELSKLFKEEQIYRIGASCLGAF